MGFPLTVPTDVIRRVSALLRGGSETISPTAHYTGYVWARRGLGPKQLATPEGFLLYAGIQPFMTVSGLLGGPTLEGFLLARHRIIDLLLEEAIEEGRVGQIIEIAAGMSPRGQRFAAKYGDRITYIEADLPAMAARKRAALAKIGSLGDHHQAVDVDAVSDDAPESLAAVAAGLDPDKGIAFVTEGLLNYLSADDVRGLWARIARAAQGFPDGVYLSDLHLAEDVGPIERIFSVALGTFVRGRLHFHFQNEAEGRQALASAGFAGAELHHPDEFADRLPGMSAPSANIVRVIEGRVGPA